MKVYLDHNATTPVAPEVFAAMTPYLTNAFGNASSIHQFGREALKAINNARKQVAEFLNCDPKEIVFTSGGTEADNHAVGGVVKAKASKGKHIITSSIEHHAVLNLAKRLEKEDVEVTFLPVSQDGVVNPEDLKKAIRDDTILVSIMMVNNETGVINPIKELAAVAAQRGVLFHTDAVQAAGKIPIDVKDLGVDLLSISAHKFYGPKGVGVLYVKKGAPLRPLLVGGHHENNKRAGTENVPGIVGMGEAARLAKENMQQHNAQISALRDRLEEKIQKAIPYTTIAGGKAPRVSNTTNIGFHFIEGEAILLNLDIKGIGVATGSACTSGTLEPSHVLGAMGISTEVAQGAIRFSFGYGNTEQEVDYVVDALSEIIPKLRNMSPLWDKFQKGELDPNTLGPAGQGCKID